MHADLRAVLDRLLDAPGPSGFEMAPAAVWREAARGFAEVRSDVLGSSFATVNPGGRPRVAILAHLDEIGLAITSIDDTGMLWIGEIGSWDPVVLTGQRVRVLTRDGEVPGVIGKRAWHLQTEEELTRAPTIASLWIDIGARDGAEAATVVRPGDRAVLAGGPVELRNGRIASRALDNRLGALVALEAARLAGEADDLQAEVVAAATVQEEIGYRGVTAAAYALEPDVAIVLDVTHVSDYPDAEAQRRRGGPRSLGSGPAVTVAPTASPLVTDALLDLAAEHGIPHSIEAEGTRTLTDMDVVESVRRGIPTGLVSVPVRYMHSPSETAELADVVAAAQLVARFCRSLRPDQEWTR